MKGILLEKIHKLDSMNQKNISKIKELRDHIKNLEIMNDDKLNQIKEADYKAQELLDEHKKIMGLLSKHETKRVNFQNLYNMIKPKK